MLLTDEETKSQRELCGVRLCSNQSDAGAGVGAGCQKDPWLDTRPALVSPDWHQRHHGAMTMPPLIPQVLLIHILDQQEWCTIAPAISTSTKAWCWQRESVTNGMLSWMINSRRSQRHTSHVPSYTRQHQLSCRLHCHLGQGVLFSSKYRL